MARFVSTDEVAGTTGAIVVVDVIRAFTTAACAFAAGAERVHLVADVADALAFKAAHPGVIAMGEDHGLRPDGFDLPNSPVLALEADLAGRTIVHRTSAGTRGAVAAMGSATRLWCAALVTASATAAAVTASGLGAPTYVITGRFPPRPDRPARSGDDDRLTAEHIESIRHGRDPDRGAVAAAVAGTDEVARTLALGDGHVHPDDIAAATDVDRFAFTMEATITAGHLHLDRRDPPR